MATLRFSELPDELTVSDDRWAWIQVLRCWATIALGIGLCAVSRSPFVWLAAFGLVGLSQYHLSVLGHHALHKNLFARLATNEFVARYLLHGPIGLPNGAMRRNHMAHHLHFEEEADYERQNYDFSLFGRGTPQGLCRWLIGVYVGGAALPAVSRVMHGAQKLEERSGRSTERVLLDWLPVAISNATLVLVWGLGTGVWWAYAVMWFLPIFTLLGGLSATRAMLEHADPRTPPQRLMTFPTSRLERYLLGSCNFNFHAEHHLQPGVPACHLERLHHYLRSRDALDSVVIVPSYRARVAQLLEELREQPTPAARADGAA